MSVDRTKVLEAAQKHLAKGNYDKAIGEFRKIVEADPSDIRTWLKIGDLYTRKGARTEAIETYGKVADRYADQGFFLKAVAVYKQILKLDPTRLDIQLKLAEMYEMLQLVSDALSTYEHVAAGYARAGKIDEALNTLQKMTELDPENIPIRIKCAEGLSKAGRTKEAADEFEVGARLLKEQGRLDDFVKVAERLLYHRPDDTAVARELAELYLERSDPKRSLAKLQLCFKADPKDVATLDLLAEAFRQLDQLPKTISVYREIARIHQEANRHEERARVLKRILELDPDDQEARQALASFAGSAASSRRDIQPPASAVVEPSRAGAPATADDDEPELIAEADDEPEVLAEDDVEVLEVDEEEDIIIVEEDVEAAEPASAPAPSSSERAASVPPDVQREAQIARLLTECDVFMRYGLKQKVAEQLNAVLQIDPGHVQARERLKDLHLEEGRVDDAIEQLLTLADVLSEDQSTASVLYLRQVLELSPGHAEAQARLTQLGASIPPPAASAAEAPAAAPASDEDDEDEVFFLDEEEEPAAGDLATPAEPVPTDDVLSLDEEPAPSTATDAAPLGDREPEPAPSSRRAIVPPPSDEASAAPASGAQAMSPPPGGPLADPLAPMTPEEFEEVPLRPSSPGIARAEARERLSMPPGEVEETLDEADFFIAQGLLEEARGTLSEALNTHPDHPLILEKLREVGQLSNRASQAAAARSSAELDLGDQSFELAEKLAEEFDEVEDTHAGSDVLDVEQVFAQFKKGVEAQVGVEDSETHFDLGIAYKEMGLLDDAIAEFRLCLSNPTRLCIAETMIGLCHIEKGEIAEGISHFKKGLYADNKSEREELGLYFELGHAYELLQDPKEALYYYQKVQKRDASFRDVEGRIRNLTQPQAQAAETPPAMAQDDIDRAFDDLMGED
ncbi:MAG TPA: tetratricopeptide repeat protein [Sandaracinaceae bacterium LLY-WYZ-13_1]|nr:tetratricopeptide repeat protein [Sandaracinaceae bacterium LLY-WYZ-13_1]